MTLLRLTNPVRNYAWGSTTAIPDLLGVPADGRPQAELWLGAHPDSPSRLPDGRSLADAIAPATLPFLVKVLSAAAPLSLQVHPDPAQAQAGYDEEQRTGVPRDAGHRRYRDPHAKPEMVLALTQFHALCGLRDRAATQALLGGLDVDHRAWPRLLASLDGSEGAAALRSTVEWLIGDDGALTGSTASLGLVDAVAHAAADHLDVPELSTTVDLAKAYPGDPGVLVALLLNRVTLQPGEALFLTAGNIHAYLQGTAIEVMGPSDNVLRAGLTRKHVDVAELLRIADWQPHPVPYVQPETAGAVTSYRPPTPDFQLVRVEHRSAEEQTALVLDGPRIALVLDGDLALDGEPLTRGESVYVPAESGPLTVTGRGVVIVAATG